MSLYGLSQRTTSGTAATASWEVRSAATNKPRIMEVGISQSVATAGVYGLGRPAAIGSTPTTPQNFVAEGDAYAPTSLTTAAVAWGTGPTVPANFNRRISCAATIGVGVIWTFPRGLDIAISNSIIIWIIATAPVCDVWSVIDE
jgi:hypothetical protein